ncbi:glucan biosynthesis protein [Loktanella salsilacus]|uniref:glucan biosynthesis protein n=1 Tax=Loktanella salsilacus TaxID=195913 RepID=UPI0020B8223C|nr:glucan biosynthesis protein G [Loktanella salsilacus]UTH47802.1 glucan biosynthesis protein [Loktanella salsilacus]
MTLSRNKAHLSRRSFLLRGASSFATIAAVAHMAAPAFAQNAAQPVPFSFEMLIERARQTAAADYVAPNTVGAPFTDLDYDDYRNVQFNEDSALWAGPDATGVLHAYHPGWLFDSTVSLFEVVGSVATPLTFTSDDFVYYGDAAGKIGAGTPLPGVAGFRINMPLNAPDRFDEVVSFLGASYFRALGKDNRYGLSARGLAVNTATSEAEEFPRFSAFWLERPALGSTSVTFYALLESESVAGAYRFVLTPGETTTVDVTTELFFRQDVAQLGIAPLTSMFLFGLNDRGSFDDYRTRVHDSEALIINSENDTLFRVLHNPEKLANSYFSAQSPKSFGLVQRHRAFDDYLDAGAHYELRPSLMVEPQGDWGTGMIRLIEIPSDLEGNDNIVAFWVPQESFTAGSSANVSYRLHWGMDPVGSRSELAQVSRTLAGHGGVAGVKPRTDQRKFVIDYEGGPLAEPFGEQVVEAQITISGGKVLQQTLQRIEGHDAMWRLVLEVASDDDATVELRANLAAGDRQLTETWVYQWRKA